jgi:hypothetical protein
MTLRALFEHCWALPVAVDALANREALAEAAPQGGAVWLSMADLDRPLQAFSRPPLA